MSWNERPISDRLVFVSNPPQKVLSTFPPKVRVTLDAAEFIGHVLLECGYVKDLNRGVWVKPHGDEPRARYPAALSKHNNQQTEGT